MDGDNDNGSFLETSISSDLALKIIQYLNVVDSGRLACVSQRYCYLVHQYRRLRGPELATTSSASMDFSSNPMGSLVNDCKDKIQTKPNLVLHFSTPTVSDELSKKLAVSFGDETVGLGAVSCNEIQVYEPGPDKGSMGKLDDQSSSSLMAMNFPGATVLPFSIRGTPSEINFDFLEHRLRYHNPTNDDNFWKAMILYATGSSSDEVTMKMQSFMPRAVIVGGVCDEGYVSVPRFSREELASMSVKQLRFVWKKYATLLTQEQRQATIVEKSDLVNQVYEGLNGVTHYEYIGFESVFGVLLGGDVPVRSVVSRGVHSVLNNNGPPRPFSDLVVESVIFSKSGFFGEDGPPVHLIRSIRDRASNAVLSPMEVIRKYLSSTPRSAQFLGLKRPGHDGFELSYMNNLAMQLDTFVVAADGSEASEVSLEGAELDFFKLNGTACTEDMDRTMAKLRDQTSHEQILGALMYTCSGRGPSPDGLIKETMSDATRFAKVFPDVPCLGFYANGEFGPVALAGNEDVFQIGRAMHQGFTAVFALFIVPVKDGPDTYNLDDSIDNVRQFIREELHASE